MKKFLPLVLLAVAAPASAQVLDLGGGGSFANLISPAANGGEFWDNLSADASASQTCNMGFFAVGTTAGCANQAAGTTANAGLLAGGSYYGGGAGNTGAVPFMFSGQFGYKLTLVGSILGTASEVGIYTISNNVYSYTAIASFGARVVNSAYVVGPGLDWGFYIKNSFNPSAGTCSTWWCSNTSVAATQQWGLMRSAGKTGEFGGYTYLAGAEDNKLEKLPNGNYYDSDYNDYLIAVTATPEPLSMALVATGLVAMAGAGYIRRRRS